jgi:hypothetical protein
MSGTRAKAIRRIAARNVPIPRWFVETGRTIGNTFRREVTRLKREYREAR